MVVQELSGFFGNVSAAAVYDRLHHEQALPRLVLRTGIEESISRGLLASSRQANSHSGKTL